MRRCGRWARRGVGGTVSGNDDVIGEPNGEAEESDGDSPVRQIISLCPYVPPNLLEGYIAFAHLVARIHWMPGTWLPGSYHDRTYTG